jgi:molybdopterin converting factor small subunit
VKTARRILEGIAIAAAVVVIIATAAALTFVNLKVIFTVDALANEYRERVEVFEIERTRHNYVMDRIERHLKQLDAKFGRPLGAKK